MTNLTFVYRTDSPSIRKVFQERQEGFLYLGSVVIQDGRDFSSGHETDYRVVRLLSFTDPSQVSGAQVDPGTYGLYPLQFRQGSVTIRGAQHQTVLLTYSPTHQFLDGSVTIKSSSALGAVSDFAIWGLGMEDPNDFYVQTATNINSGGVTGGYTRHSAVFVPHRDTRYLAVGARVYSMPNTGTWRNHYFKKWMLEKALIGGTYPTAKYGKAREVVVQVHPDRLNYFTNPGFEVNANDVTAGAGAPTRAVTSAQHDQNGTKSLLLTSTASSANLSVGWTSAPVVMPEGWWTLSWYVFSPVARTCYPTVTQNGVTQTGAASRVGPNQWTRVSWSFQTSLLTTFDLAFNHVADASQAAGATVYMDSVLLEFSPVLREYFDGNTSPDTIWEVNGTSGQSRSYLYKNYADRFEAINHVLDDNVPFGISSADPVFGTLPVESGYNPVFVPPLDTTYGAGAYGSGSYGG